MVGVPGCGSWQENRHWVWTWPDEDRRPVKAQQGAVSFWTHWEKKLGWMLITVIINLGQQPLQRHVKRLQGNRRSQKTLAHKTSLLVSFSSLLHRAPHPLVHSFFQSCVSPTYGRDKAMWTEFKCRALPSLKPPYQGVQGNNLSTYERPSPSVSVLGLDILVSGCRYTTLLLSLQGPLTFAQMNGQGSKSYQGFGGWPRQLFSVAVFLSFCAW